MTRVYVGMALIWAGVLTNLSIALQHVWLMG
jgi:hypothetical protein